MLKFIVLRLQGVKRLILNLPAATPSFHHEWYALGSEMNLGNPGKVKLLAVANFPIIQKIDQNIRMRFISKQ